MAAAALTFHRWQLQPSPVLIWAAAKAPYGESKCFLPSPPSPAGTPPGCAFHIWQVQMLEDAIDAVSKEAEEDGAATGAEDAPKRMR